MGPEKTLGIVMSLIVAAAGFWILALLPEQDPLAINLGNRLMAPNSDHWFGTDDLGRDLLSRVSQGAALTVGISVSALLSSVFLGVVLGSISGFFYRRWPDRVTMWLADFLVAVPLLVVIVAVLSVAGSGLWKAYLVLTAIIWVGPARIVRAEVVRTMPLEYVQAERALGTPEWRILLGTILPGCIHPAVVFAVAYLPEVIALEAGLSFLGLGVPPPNPSLGKMIFDGIGFLGVAPWMVLIPASMLFLTVAGIRLVSWVIKRNETSKVYFSHG